MLTKYQIKGGNNYENFSTRKITVLVMFYLTFMLATSSTVFALSNDDIPIERILLSAPNPLVVNEDVNENENSLKIENYLVCPKCDKGEITIRDITALDYEAVWPGHWKSCNINYQHYMCWYRDYRETKCNSCSFHDLWIIKQDYGWHCRTKHP